MAWIYQMSIRCANEWAAKALACKYAGQTFTFSAPDKYGAVVCKMGAAPILEEGEWWTEIVPSGVTNTGISDVGEALRATEFCNVMYGMLRNDRYFDFALAGVETLGFLTGDELKKEIIAGEAKRFAGLVISKTLLGEAMPSWIEMFSESHGWIPKTPEKVARS